MDIRSTFLSSIFAFTKEKEEAGYQEWLKSNKAVQELVSELPLLFRHVNFHCSIFTKFIKHT